MKKKHYSAPHADILLFPAAPLCLDSEEPETGTTTKPQWSQPEISPFPPIEL